MAKYISPRTETCAVQIAANLLSTSGGNPDPAPVNGGALQEYAW